MTRSFLSWLKTPAGFCTAMVVYFGVGLGADHFVGLHGQIALGALTWVVLIVSCRPLPLEQRVLVGLVVVVASSFEVFASLIWGLYHYRLHNIPMFVPPGHGLVYLTGLRLSEASWVRRNWRVFIGGVLAISVAWSTLGVSVLPRLDVTGAIGAFAFIAFLLWGRAPTVYGGVFLAVMALEFYGTAIGTWRWVSTDPWMHLPAGNPPSGVAGGYVLFDVLAIAAAPAAMALIAAVPDLAPWRVLRLRQARAVQPDPTAG